MNDPFEKAKDSNWVDYGYTWYSGADSLSSDDGAKLRFRYYPKAKKPIGSLSELFTTVRSDGFANVELVVGRKILNWNPADQFWVTGHLGGRENFELLSSAREGIVGTIVKFKPSKNFLIELMFSPLLIPELNPNVDVENGKVTSAAEWAKKPPQRTLVLNGNLVPNKYELRMPPLEDLIIKPGGGLYVEYGFNRSWISAYWSYKPEPRVRVNAEGGLTEEQDEVSVPFWPFINYHQVYGTDYRYVGNDWKFNLGLERNCPDHGQVKGVEIEYFKIKSTYFDESFLHSSVIFDLPFSYKSTLSLNFLNLLSDSIGLSDSFLDEPVRWQRALGLNFSIFLVEKVRLILEYIHDMRSEDRTLMTKIQYYPYKGIFTELGSETVWAPILTNYWSMYRTNDTAFINFGTKF